ncbi:PREDICTED: biotin carboxylase, chloroplastic-like isoform X5 [Tarenaya hassleriana]|uniref:biotin carboxylase, chloroplastic-like isoform X5 n=1 Tax=Tarenaya hassleriana TaxID=28532 RepID=UPI00053C3097|nr:PREDICTED: biotin carboxylase, chloroplastic-like isoform X5 [Tarenaya hassleriana]
MGISYVAAYSTKEKDALRVKLADEAVCTGKSPSSQSQQDFRNGKVDKAFIVKHEEELVAVRTPCLISNSGLRIS